MTPPPPLPPAIAEPLAAGAAEPALAATIAHFGCQAGTLHLLREGALHLAASHGIPPHIVQIVQTVPLGKGIAGLAAERREPITICNLQTDTSGQARPAARTTGLEGSIAVPIMQGEDLRGVLGIAKASAHDWTPAETAELLAIGRAFSALP